MRFFRSLSLVLILFLSCIGFLAAWSGSFTLHNSTGFTVYWFYLTPAGADSWGQDHLGAGVLLDGESFSLDLVDIPEPFLDIRVIDEDEDSYTFYRFDAERGELRLVLDHLDRRRQ